MVCQRRHKLDKSHLSAQHFILPEDLTAAGQTAVLVARDIYDTRACRNPVQGFRLCLIQPHCCLAGGRTAVGFPAEGRLSVKDEAEPFQQLTQRKQIKI